MGECFLARQAIVLRFSEQPELSGQVKPSMASPGLSRVLQNRLDCKHSASTGLPGAMSSCSASMQRVKPDLAPSLHFGGIQRNPMHDRSGS
jgi:hypothetical protein